MLLGQIATSINTVQFLVCVFFPIQQWPCHNNIVTGKSLNLFDDSAAEFVYQICTPDTVTNSQTDRVPTEINNSGAVFKVRVLVELGML